MNDGKVGTLFPEYFNKMLFISQGEAFITNIFA